MKNNGRNPETGGWPETEPHEKFLELCALLTSGDLTGKEREELRAHLADCSECQQVLKEFEAVADVGMSLLRAPLSASDSPEPSSFPPSGGFKGIAARTTARRRTARSETKPAENGIGLRFPWL
jgi:anti-sigma factor RsiW